MKNRNNNQIELPLPASINDTPFFRVRRHYPRPQRPCRRSRARWWFQQMHVMIDSIPDPVTPSNS